MYPINSRAHLFLKDLVFVKLLHELVDFQFSHSCLWAVWTVSDGSTLLSSVNLDTRESTSSLTRDALAKWEPAILEPPLQGLLFPWATASPISPSVTSPKEFSESPSIDSTTDPRQAYLAHIFHPGRFPLAVITKALAEAILEVAGAEGEGVGAEEDDVGAVRALQASALILLALSGSAVNGIVVLVFIRRPTLRSPSNRFVLSLVIANLLAAATVFPVVTIHVARIEVSRHLWWGQIVGSLGTLSATASVFSILAIAVDRYRAVTSPLHYSMTTTGQRSRLIIASTWLLAFILATLPLLFAFVVTKPDTAIEGSPLTTASTVACITAEERLPAFPIAIVIPSKYSTFRICYAVVLASLGFCIPFLALCWIYVLMYLAARKNSQRTRRHSLSASAHQDQGAMVPPHHSSTSPLPEIGWTGGRRKPPPRRRCSNASLPALLFREEGRAVKTAALVIASFLLCWAPFFCTLLLDSRQSGKRLPDALRFCALLAALGNGPLTPFLYVFRNEAARTEAMKLLFWWRVREDRGTPRWGDSSMHSPPLSARPRAPSLGQYRRGKMPAWCPPRGAVSLDSGREIDPPRLSPRSRSWSERQDSSASINSFNKCGQCVDVECLATQELTENSTIEFIPAMETVEVDHISTLEGPDKIESRREVVSKELDEALLGEVKSSTFRLTFLPRAASRRCQACIRQNSDSSSGSGHPLLREGATIVDVRSSPRRAPTPTHSGEDEMKDGLTEVPMGGKRISSGSNIILELEEQFNQHSSAMIATHSRAERFSTSSNLTQETSLASSGMGSTVDGSVDTDETRHSVSVESPISVRRQESKITDDGFVSQRQSCGDAFQGKVEGGAEYAPRRARRKLQRLAAVDDMGDATLPEEDAEVFEDLPEDKEDDDRESNKSKRDDVIDCSTATSNTLLRPKEEPLPTLILQSCSVTPIPAKTRVTTGIKARFFRPAFRVPRFDF